MGFGVEPDEGREAARIIKEALAGLRPRVAIAEAASRAGITEDGWMKVIRTGRGYERTFIKMAGAVGVKPQVCEVLGVPLDANVVPLPAPGDLTPEDVYEEAVLANPDASAALKRELIELHRAPGGSREIMAKLGIYPRRLDQARHGS